MSVRRHLAWMGLSQGAFFVLQFFGSAIVAHLLSPYEVGVYALAAAIAAVLSTVQAFGFAGFMVREPVIDDQVTASVFTANLFISAALSVLLIGVGLFSKTYLHAKGVGEVVLVMASLPLFGALEFLPATRLEREARFKAIALVGTARNVTAQLVTLILAFMGASYMSLACGQVVAAVVSAAAFNLVGREHISFRFSLSQWRRLLRYGSQMLAISGIAAISQRIAELTLGRVVGLSALGLYSRASSVNNLAWDNIHLMIGRVVFVDLATQRRGGASLREPYLRVVENTTALLWPAFAGLGVIAGPLILNVYGAKWLGAVVPLIMLAAGSMVSVAITMTWELFVICEETGRQAKIEFIRAGVGLVMFVCGCFFGLTGAAASRLTEATFAVFFYRPHLSRMTETRTRDFVPIYFRSALVAAAAVAPAAMLMALYGGSPRTPFVYVLLAVAGGGLLWFGAIILFNHPLALELKHLRPRAPAKTYVVQAEAAAAAGE